MLNLGIQVTYATSKRMAAKAATATNKVAASARKQSLVLVDTSAQHLTKADLAYFSSEKFQRTMKSFEDRRLAMEYGSLIAFRKRKASHDRAIWLAEAVIYVDIFNAHADGFSWSYEEIRDLFKGYRSQALREAKKASEEKKAFNSLVYWKIAEMLSDKKEIRTFLKAINRPIVRTKPLL